MDFIITVSKLVLTTKVSMRNNYQNDYYENKPISTNSASNTKRESGAPNEKNIRKSLRIECSFLLPHIVLWPSKRIFVKANIILSVRMR